MELQNHSWTQRMQAGAENINSLTTTDTIKELSKILRINIRVVSSAGSVYLHQLSNVFNDVLNVYRLYSEQIIQACATQGPIATRLTVYKVRSLFLCEIRACLLSSVRDG